MIPWREFADAINRVAVSDTGEHIAQPGFGVDEVEPGGLDERVDRGRPLAALVRAGEEVVLAAERHRAEAVLGAVVVRLEPGVVAEAGQRRPDPLPARVGRDGGARRGGA